MINSYEEQLNARWSTISNLKAQEKEIVDRTKEEQPPEMQGNIEQLSDQGVSSWLGALPIADHGLNLNKGEFQDALCLRYNMRLQNLPSRCPCGDPFNQTHALNCHKGGFVNARHDKIRDFEAKMLNSVCNDVETEPHLQTVINKQNYPRTAILNDEARLDVRARGFWRDGQNSFFDVKVTNLNCQSQINKSTKTIMKSHENEKKRNYNKRVMEVEHGTFTPLIFSTTGVMSHECNLYHKALAEKIATKKGEKYSDVMCFLRVKLSFLALKSALLCLRGSRALSSNANQEQTGDYSLIINEIGL